MLVWTDLAAQVPDSRKSTKVAILEVPAGSIIVAKVTILGFLGLPQLSQASRDRPARPPEGAKAAKVTKVVIPGIKVPYSQAGIPS